VRGGCGRSLGVYEQQVRNTKKKKQMRELVTVSVLY
jgi:hypothetical protein